MSGSTADLKSLSDDLYAFAVKHLDRGSRAAQTIEAAMRVIADVKADVATRETQAMLANQTSQRRFRRFR